MDSPTDIRSPATTDNGRCVKLICSFLGSILPRPQDGKLRYVGGETQIVSVSRDISYEELMGKMKEVYEGVAVLKYKHPDEGLDTLVSVVNDDDVVNMMDKLDSGDEFTGLMIFLFSQSDQDGSHFIDGDDFERSYVDALNSLNDDSERRYIDALNSLNDTSELKMLQQMEFLTTEDNNYVGDQFFNPQNSMENGIHSQRSGELSMSQYDLPHIWIPHQQPMGQRYNEMDTPWSPPYYSPRHHGHHDPRALAEFPSSPSGTRYHMPFLESGFPGNFLYGHHAIDGNCICEQCRITFQRAQPHLEHPNIPSLIANQCAECSSNRNTFTVNYDAKLQPTMYPNEHSNDHRSVYNEFQNPGREWGLQRQTSVPVEESRRHFSGSARMTDHYVSDVPNMNFPHAHGSASDGHTLPSNYVHQLAGPELGAELFPDQTMAAIPHLRIPSLEERSPRYGNAPSSYGVDNNYAVAHGHTPDSAFRINAPRPVHNGLPHEATTTPRQLVDGMIMSGSIGREGSPGLSIGPDSQLVHNGPPYEATTTALQLVDGMITSGSIRREGGPRFSLGLDSQRPGVVSSQKFQGHDMSAIPEHPYAGSLKLNPKALVDGIHPPQDIVAGTDVYISKIEPTRAEAEANARGLQTIKNDDLEEIRELGSGAYGAVFHGKWKGSDVAIKRIKASCFTGRPSERARLIADFWKEALILSSLHHPNVVFFYGVVRDGPDGSLATLTELMDGSLKQFLHKKDRTIDHRKRLIIAMDVAFGMEYLHGKNVVHFDLKCDNILVNMRDPQRPVCKIGDLGLSKVKQLTLVSGGVRGTLPWMAPELLSGKSNMVSEKVDVYSFGIVMWELLTGDEPYADIHYTSIIGGIVNSTLRPKIPTWCDPKWKSLMESCWASDPIERPSFSEISKKLRTLIILCRLPVHFVH